MGIAVFTKTNWVSSDVLNLFSGYAGVHGGFAAVFGNKWFSGEWPYNVKDLRITDKELFLIVFAIDIWGSLLSNHKILFLTDNAAVADIIIPPQKKNKQ